MSNSSYGPANITSISIKKLSKQFSLISDGQDWEATSANIEKISEFIAHYKTESSYTDDDKFALMQLILNSLEQMLGQVINLNALSLKEFDRYWSDIRNILFIEQNLHAHSIAYFYHPNAEEMDYLFHISPFIRGIPIRFNIQDFVNEEDEE